MSLLYTTVPTKTLGTSISASATAFTLNNITGWSGSNLTAADFGTVAYGVFRNSTSTQLELFSWDPATIASASITILKRGLNFTGDLTTELTARKYAWVKGDTRVDLGTDTPQLFQFLKEYIDGISVAGAPNASTTVKGIVQASTLAQVRARTATGATGAILVATPDVLTDLPTAIEKDYIAACTGKIEMYAGAAAPTGFLLCDGSAVSRTTYAALFAVTSTLYGVGDGSTTFNVPDGRGRHFIGAGAGTKVATFASRASNVLTVTGLSNVANNEFQTGQAVTYHTSGSVITGLTNDTVYYIVRVTNTTFSLATSLANSQNGTLITLTSDGTGTQTFTLTLTTRTRGDYGGEENHAMSSSELITHAHSLSAFSMLPTSGGGSSNYNSTGSAPPTSSGNTSSTGGNAGMNVMSPFFVGNWIIKT